MVYEVCALLYSSADESAVKKIRTMMDEVCTQFTGEILISDDWGVRSLAQVASAGQDRGHYLYFMYKGPAGMNKEIERRLGINEDVMKKLLIKAGEEKDIGNLVKNYKSPFVRQTSDEDYDPLKDKKSFSRKRSCWFSANKIRADWKDPSTYAWLVTDFGKIAPSRVSGITSKHQKFATSAIKQARLIGLASNVSSQIAE